MLTKETVTQIQTLEKDLGMKISSDSDLSKMSEQAVNSYLNYLKDSSSPKKPNPKK